MKYTKAAIYLFISVLMQMSFLRLVVSFSLLPDLPLVVLFILSYRLPFSGFLILVALTGAFIDLFSAVHFGSSIAAAVAAFLVCHYIRENFLKRKNFGNIVLSSITAFSCFYPFLFLSNRFLDLFSDNKFTFNILDRNIGTEFIISAAIAAILAYLFASKINYVNIRDYKRFFKVSA